MVRSQLQIKSEHIAYSGRVVLLVFFSQTCVRNECDAPLKSIHATALHFTLCFHLSPKKGITVFKECEMAYANGIALLFTPSPKH